MSSMLLTTSTSPQLFRSATLPSPSSPSLSPRSDDIVMEFPSSPPFLPHDIPSTPTTPGPGSGSRSYRPPNSAKRTRRITHVNTDPYPTSTMHQNTRRLSAIPTDNDVEDAYRNRSDFEASGNMSPVTRRRLPTLPTRSVFHDSTIQPFSQQNSQLLSPLPIRTGAPMTLVPPVAPRPVTTAAEDLNESLAQAIKLLSLEKKPESYPSTDASSQNSPHASSTTSYADDHFQSQSSFVTNYQSSLPDPEELLKEIVRNSLQSLHALRLAKAMERDIRSSRRASMEDGMELEGGTSSQGSENSGTAMQVVAYLEQSVSTINSARQYIEFAEETLCDTRDRVRDTLMKG
ncbi:hypothetical protein ABW19_dt0209373 [Dactylella cylindrospora]|nr:hypothetical protein ABW19_dt0209373 [Dactylella cylindrospora]